MASTVLARRPPGAPRPAGSGRLGLLVIGPEVQLQPVLCFPGFGYGAKIRPGSRSADAGDLLAAAGTADPIDATVVLLAAPGDRILTSDPDDLARLAAAAVHRPVIIAC
jgi:hypothetical protein